jgi:hypothetical protein
MERPDSVERRSRRRPWVDSGSHRSAAQGNDYSTSG